MKKKLIEIFHNYSGIENDCILINIKRFYYLSIIAIPIRILNIFFFTHSDITTNTWKQNIIICHLILLIFFINLFFITMKLKKKTEVTNFMRALQYIVPIIILFSGIAITTIDQLVTTNISPFLLVSIVFGAVFLIRPLVSAIIYLVSYVVFYYSIALTINHPHVLLSNRVNGITVIALGFLISIMSWYYNYINIIQKRHIDKQQKQLEQMAYFDPLTNIYNRHFFNELVEKELSAMKRYLYNSVIILLDIDGFKNINDSYGHLVGDQILKEVAQMLSNNIRKSDTVFRFGGEEFVILAPKTSLDDGYALAEKLRKIIAEKTFIVDSIKIEITASFGVSLLHPKDKHKFENYYSLVDKALYAAKNKGKNRVEKVLK